MEVSVLFNLLLAGIIIVKQTGEDGVPHSALGAFQLSMPHIVVAFMQCDDRRCCIRTSFGVRSQFFLPFSS